MALNTLRCNHLTPLGLRGLIDALCIVSLQFLLLSTFQRTAAAVSQSPGRSSCPAVTWQSNRQITPQHHPSPIVYRTSTSGLICQASGITLFITSMMGGTTKCPTVYSVTTVISVYRGIAVRYQLEPLPLIAKITYCAMWLIKRCRSYPKGSQNVCVCVCVRALPSILS